MTEYARLYVNTTPGNATIEILASKVQYKAGVNIAPGKYTIEVSKKGLHQDPSVYGVIITLAGSYAQLGRNQVSIEIIRLR